MGVEGWRGWHVLGAIVALGFASTVWASDHSETPLLIQDDFASVDLSDLYLFTSPENPDNVVFVLTLNPGAGQTVPAPFRRRAKYNLLLDRNGDAKEDARIRFLFSEPDENGRQVVKLRGVGLKGLRGQGRTGEDIELKKGVRLHAGWFDDPFFFDREGYAGEGGRSLCDGSAADSFARADVAAIVLEMPKSRLRSSSVGVWARTRAAGNQVDRLGFAGINSLIVPEPARGAYNRAKPRNDLLDFFELILEALTGLGNDPTDASVVAGFYLPDILRLDFDEPALYPNGRRLEEDVIDLTLPLLGNSPAESTDCVDANDRPFRTTFPYLAEANGVGIPCQDSDLDGFPVLTPADCDPAGVPLDCNDSNDTIYPGAAEACDTRDSDCDGSLVDEFTNSDTDPAPDCVDIDDDNDGVFDEMDCQPTNPLVSPDADEICGNLVDDDCDMMTDEPGCVAAVP